MEEPGVAEDGVSGAVDKERVDFVGRAVGG